MSCRHQIIKMWHQLGRVRFDNPLLVVFARVVFFVAVKFAYTVLTNRARNFRDFLVLVKASLSSSHLLILILEVAFPVVIFSSIFFFFLLLLVGASKLSIQIVNQLRSMVP